MNPSFDAAVMHFLDTTGKQFLDNLWELLNFLKDNLGNLLWRLLVIVFIFFCAGLVMKWISAFTSHTMKKERELLSVDKSRRVDTLMTLIRSTARYLVYFVAFLLVLAQFGNGMVQNVVLAVGSIGGIAFGFGAQNLVKDVVTGLFMIFENQFSVGDYIQTEDAVGTVEATALRVTYLRSAKGDQIIIPNGTIQRVINYTRGSYVATITVSTSYESNTRKVIGIMEEALREYGEAHWDIIEELPVVRGIDSLADSTINISIACKVKPMKQWEVERGMRLAIKEAFDRRGVEFPYPRMVTIPWEDHLSPPPIMEDDDLGPTPFGWETTPVPEFEDSTLLDDSLEDHSLLKRNNDDDDDDELKENDPDDDDDDDDNNGSGGSLDPISRGAK